MSGPAKKTRQQIEYELLDAMKGILGSCVTTEALHHPNTMTIDHILMNVHLWERCGIVNAALTALKEYKGQPRGYEVIQ